MILYIAEKTADDPSFGDTHLNKVLYWADFDAYGSLGRPVTGARYFKLPFGPGAKPLMPIRDELAEEGFVEIVEPPAAATKRERPSRSGLRTPRFSRTRNWSLSTCDLTVV